MSRRRRRDRSGIIKGGRGGVVHISYKKGSLSLEMERKFDGEVPEHVKRALMEYKRKAFEHSRIVNSIEVMNRYAARSRQELRDAFEMVNDMCVTPPRDDGHA